MRLAYLVSQYPAITHTFILREIRTLRNQGFEIEIVSIRPPDRPVEKLSSEEREEAAVTWSVLGSGIGIFLRAHLTTLLSRPAKYCYGLFSAFKLGGWSLKAVALNLAYFAEAVIAGWRLHSRGIDHLHTHFSSTVALFVGRIFPISVSVMMHGPGEFDDRLGFYIAEKVAEARFVTAISQYARSQCMLASRPEHWDKIEVSPLGVDPSLFAPRPHRDQPERLEIITVGRLAAVKAQAVLVEAVARLARRYPTIHLRIVGGGPEHGALAKMIADKGLSHHVELMGPCPQEQVRAMYRETDIFALASFAEGVPVVLMEAMAMEIPCVSTGITGVPELIRHGVDGWLVPPSDPDALAEAIAHLIDDAELRQSLGAAGRLRVQDRYDLAKNTRRLGEIFQRRLSAPNTSS